MQFFASHAAQRSNTQVWFQLSDLPWAPTYTFDSTRIYSAQYLSMCAHVCVYVCVSVVLCVCACACVCVCVCVCVFASHVHSPGQALA